MKDSKNFFKKNNLNKGYRTQRSTTYSERISKDPTRILPPIDMMSEYEDLYPGTLKQLLDMAKLEQQHRHQLETAAQQKSAAALKLGKYCTLILVGMVCITSIILISKNHFLISTIFTIIAFGSLYKISKINAPRKNNNYTKNNNYYQNTTHNNSAKKHSLNKNSRTTYKK